MKQVESPDFFCGEDIVLAQKETSNFGTTCLPPATSTPIASTHQELEVQFYDDVIRYSYARTYMLFMNYNTSKVMRADVCSSPVKPRWNRL
eukprot:3123414-Pleurochrysis_carterae.AAC.1